MAVEVVSAKLFVEEAQLQVAQNALAFVLAGAGVDLANEAWRLVEDTNIINFNVRLDNAEPGVEYTVELTDATNSGDYAGLMFIGDDEGADDFDKRLAHPTEHQLYGGEFWPTLLHIDGKTDGILTGEATVVVSGYKNYGEAIAPEVKALAARSYEDDRLTVPALKQYLASLK
ncbi:MAG TPA: hypothetical protein VM124_00810 [Candidatus Limnocylindrales bacterium]|nr:hypothetical protein [Candidatus Limnocylindrales bacterium]